MTSLLNPYVGPLPFQRGDASMFFGRDADSREVASLVIAHPVSLLHATSGSGKTSLINAGVIPLRDNEGFDVLPLARFIGLSEDEASRAANVYAAGVIAGWQHDVPALASIEAKEISLKDTLELIDRPKDANCFVAPRVVIFDQFEELFTAYTAQWDQRRAFIEQLVTALEADSLLRIMLSLREDYLAHVEALASFFPDGLRTRIRIERLGVEDALEAVTRPAELAGRPYTEGVAEKLVDNLLTLRVPTPVGGSIEIRGEFVEPVQLQVVCESLWSSLAEDATAITAADLRKLGNFDDVLGGFYEAAVLATTAATDRDEYDLRAWIENSFITSIGTRGMIYRVDEPGDHEREESFDVLERVHLIRGEWRSGTHWYELTHDRLIEPIRRSNASFVQRYARCAHGAVTTTRQRADAVFEGVGISKAIAFAGAVCAAERDAGVGEWVNVAGCSAGSIVAALLAAGYDSEGLRRILANADYERFVDYGFGGRWIGGIVNTFRGLRGFAPGRYFFDWIREQLAASPLARELGKDELTFADVRRRDVPPRSELPDIADDRYVRSLYRLHVIASDITAGRMMILPEDLPDYTDLNGRPFDRDSFPIAEAVRMSVSYPFLFAPVELHRESNAHYIVDGALLSNFPIWLFDSPRPQRPTWGFRLHGGVSVFEGMPRRKIPRLFWPFSLGSAMFAATTEGWARESLQRVESARTVSIPTHSISSTEFAISKADADSLFAWGEVAAHDFFSSPTRPSYYLNEFGTAVATERQGVAIGA